MQNHHLEWKQGQGGVPTIGGKLLDAVGMEDILLARVKPVGTAPRLAL